MTASTEVVRADGASLSPAELVERDVSVATALGQLVEDRRLAKDIQGRKYLTAEAWSAAGRILGLSVYIDDPEPFTDSQGGKGYRARAHVRDRDGNLVASATAICTRSERRWATADEYAVMSMAQTRANGKAHRTGLSSIAVLAGYEATPAEEMPEPAAAPAPQAAPASEPLTKVRLDALEKWATSLGLTHAEIVMAISTVTGKKRLDSLTHGNAKAVRLAIEAVAHRDPVADGSADEPAEEVPSEELDFGAES